jgi:coenzyme F420-reducing hydrogenase beta subunit
MRIPAQCPHCREVDERRQSMHEVSSGKRSHELDVVDLHAMDTADVHSGKLTLRCEQGHTTVVTLPIPAFELLFDFGCSALLDGYPREAVTSFASSFERFEEFACRFLLARRKVSFEGVDAWWKKVAAQSERQKGSFVALWIAEFFTQPPTLPGKLIELRNDCVHKGRIPPESKAKA